MCALLGKMARILGWIIGGLFLLVAIAYALLLLINRHDSEPSAGFLQLTHMAQDRPTPPDSENGYIIMMGFSAPAGADAFPEGMNNIADLNTWVKKHGIDYYEKPVAEPISGALENQPDEVSSIISACNGSGKECAGKIFIGHRSISRLTKENPWILERYETLISRPAWRERNAFTAMSTLPPYTQVIKAQQIFLLQAWVDAFTGNAKAASEAVERDHLFWRRVLAETDSLVTKMIATSALRRNYVLGSLALVAEPLGKERPDIPASWAREISSKERSLSNVFGGELSFSKEIFKKARTGDNLFVDENGKSAPAQKLAWRVIRPFFLQQDSCNIHAQSFMMNEAAFSVSLDLYPALVRAPYQGVAQDHANKHAWSLYNPVGRLLLKIGDGTYGDYYIRLADLEGARRLASLTVALHRQHIRADDMPAAIAGSTLRNPYNNQPFQWDRETGFLSFHGLEPNESRATFEFFYRP